MSFENLVQKILPSSLEFSEDKKVCWLEGFPADHRFSTKRAGNMSGLDEEVTDNRKQLYDRLGVEKEDVVHMNPQHTSRVGVVGKEDAGPVVGDALFTETPGLALTVAPADCYSVALSEGSQLALIHLSRKNVNSNLLKRTASMFNADNVHIKVAIAPGIRECCFRFPLFKALAISVKSFKSNLNFEDEVVSRLKSQFPTLEVKVELQEKIVKNLLDLGFFSDNIYYSGECTGCSTINIDGEEEWTFFSHSRNDRNEGRNFVVFKN